MRSSLITALFLSQYADAKPLWPSLSRRGGIGGNGVEWRQVTCDYGTLGDSTNDPVQQFIDSQAAVAFAEAHDAYKGNNSDMLFTNWLANYFNARPDLNCGNLEGANCEVTLSCGQAGTANADVNSPAGYFILNSVISLHQHYYAQYKGLMNAYTFVLGQAGSFTSNFATQPDQLPESQEKLALDIVLMVWGVISSFTFNSWLKNVPLFKKGNDLSVLKDITNTLVSQSITATKDSMSAVDDLKVQNSMDTFLSEAVHSWVNITNVMVETVMEKEPLTLYSNIVNGKMWDPNASNDAMDLTDEAMQVLFAYMIPAAWKLADPEVGAFIATADGLTDNDGTCEGADPWATYKDNADWEVDSGDAFVKGHVCIDGKAYFLLRMERSDQTKELCHEALHGNTTPGLNCKRPKAEGLPGVATLDGSHWGGLTVQTLTGSAVGSWNDNGKKNGWVSVDPTTADGLNTIYDKGINAPGMVNIPVCSMEEAFNNAYNYVKTDNWPCN